MKRIYLTLLLLMSISCSSIDFMNTDYLIYENTTKDIQQCEYIFSFDSITSPDNWIKYNTLEEMQEACQIPEEIIDHLTTERLVELCMTYPLYGNYKAYNNQEIGISNTIKGFNGFSELKERKDAGRYLLNYYKNLEITKILEEINNNKNYLGIIHLGYVEWILYSEEFSPLLKPLFKELIEIATDKLEDKKKYSSIFSNESINNTTKLLLIGEDRTISSSSIRPSWHLYDTVVQTKYGQEVIACINLEALPSENISTTQFYSNAYPNATVIGESTRSYNCHAYAWRVSDGDSKCWIKEYMCYPPNSPLMNIDRYWTADYYWRVNTSHNGYKVNYPSSDHSAIVYSDNLYVSKWGAAPLMRHAPNYGPYQNMNIRNYYTHDPFYSLLQCSIGMGTIPIGTQISCYPGQEPPVPISHYEWQVIDGHGEDAIENGRAILHTSSGNTATFSFTINGLYEIYLNSYRVDNSHIGSYWYEAIVEP